MCPRGMYIGPISPAQFRRACQLCCGVGVTWLEALGAVADACVDDPRPSSLFALAQARSPPSGFCRERRPSRQSLACFVYYKALVRAEQKIVYQHALRLHALCGFASRRRDSQLSTPPPLSCCDAPWFSWPTLAVNTLLSSSRVVIFKTQAVGAFQSRPPGREKGGGFGAKAG